ncbi:MAG: putative glycosyltransferase [Candidatus Scalindua rubra]|uniref:Putative glycosyltransferase n=1 Tax=Candidatus Scalindua rubra TaxID=1872076 RepID=A0A1E3XFW8_9BACT|nr:MAG: putative glycosyltransferase [Candidatus Scalindua rubra]
MSEILKICHIGWAHSIHVERLMRWFARKGHIISIITDHPKNIDGVEVYDIRRKPDPRPRLERYKDFHFNIRWKWLYRLNEIVRIKKLVDEISPDIIHSHSLWYPGYFGVYLKGYPFVITVLNGDILWKKDGIDIYTRLRTNWAMKKADIITGVSKELVNACIRYGANKDRVHVMRRGVNLSKFNYGGSKAEIRRKLGLPESAKIVLSPRNIGSFYNVDKIVEAIPRIIREVEDVKFVFIWHGHNKEREEKLNNLASKLGVKEFIRNDGVVSHDKVALYHKASDVMVSVSQHDSGPVALQEAMACGDVPVISNLSCVREWITDGWNGLLVEPNNVNQIAESTIRLLENGQMIKTFAERNWKLIQEKGSQDYWMGKMEELYYKLLAGKRNRGSLADSR